MIRGFGNLHSVTSKRRSLKESRVCNSSEIRWEMPFCPSVLHRKQSETYTNYDPKTNPPNIALFLGLNISRCQGCRGVIDRKVLQSPKDIAIRYKDFRSYTDPKTNTTKTTYGNIYFHLDLKCTQKKISTSSSGGHCCC